MMNCQRFTRCAMVVAVTILTGCGGGSESSESTTTTTTTARPSVIAGRNVTFTVGDGAKKTILPIDFHRHTMNGFRGGWHQSYANVSLKMLISAMGPKTLLDHLENYKKTTQSPEQSAAAGRFIELIHKAYDSSSSVDTEHFIASLQNLAPFNQRDAAGDWKFKLEGDIFAEEKEPEKFLPLISELFRLDTLAGWSFDVDEIYVHQGEERANTAARNPFQMFQPVQLNRINPADFSNFTLQKLVDLLHADQEAQVQWNANDAQPATVKVRRQVRIADVENFKRLTISLEQGSSQAVLFSLLDSVTLPVIDQKTKQKMVLTLSPTAAISWSNSRYAIRIKDHDGKWHIHEESVVWPAAFASHTAIGRLINFAVTNAAPAP